MRQRSAFTFIYHLKPVFLPLMVYQIKTRGEKSNDKPTGSQMESAGTMTELENESPGGVRSRFDFFTD